MSDEMNMARQRAQQKSKKLLKSIEEIIFEHESGNLNSKESYDGETSDGRGVNLMNENNEEGANYYSADDENDCENQANDPNARQDASMSGDIHNNVISKMLELLENHNLPIPVQAKSLFIPRSGKGKRTLGGEYANNDDLRMIKSEASEEASSKRKYSFAISNQSSDEMEMENELPDPPQPQKVPRSSASMSNQTPQTLSVPATEFQELFQVCQNTNNVVKDLRKEVRNLRGDVNKLKTSHLLREETGIVKELREEVRNLRKEMNQLKAGKVIPEDVGSSSSHQPIREEPEQVIDEIPKFAHKEHFEDFCNNLTDHAKSQAVVKYFQRRYGQQHVGETVRNIMKAIMTDDLMLMYNRSGTNHKFAFPKPLEYCIYDTANSFHDANTVETSRGGTPVVVTIRNEVSKQIEIYLSNAKTRINRNQKKNQSNCNNLVLGDLGRYTVL